MTSMIAVVSYTDCDAIPVGWIATSGNAKAAITVTTTA